MFLYCHDWLLITTVHVKGAYLLLNDVERNVVKNWCLTDRPLMTHTGTPVGTVRFSQRTVWVVMTSQLELWPLFKRPQNDVD